MVNEIVKKDDDNNSIIGFAPIMDNSKIIFDGHNNILYCAPDVTLQDSRLWFKGNDSLIFLCSGKHKLKVNIYSNSVCCCGSNPYYTKSLSAIISEQKHFFMGDNCMVSLDVFIRNSDAHLIYDCKSGKRINKSQSVYIGDHVWIGQDVTILKGTRIDSGSVIGAGSVVAGKTISHNTIWGGNPAKKINNDVFGDRQSVHEFDQADTERSMVYQDYLNIYKEDCHPDYWIYEYNDDEVIDWDYLDNKLSSETVVERLRSIMEINACKSKNRFVHK